MFPASRVPGLGGPGLGATRAPGARRPAAAEAGAGTAGPRPAGRARLSCRPERSVPLAFHQGNAPHLSRRGTPAFSLLGIFKNYSHSIQNTLNDAQIDEEKVSILARPV